MSAIEGQKPIFRRPASGFACASCSSHRARILGSRSSSALAFLATVAKSAGVKPLSLSTKAGASSAERATKGFGDLIRRHRQRNEP